MQTALLFVLLPFAVLAIGGGFIAFSAFRNAPEGHEDANGFHFENEFQAAHARRADEPMKLAA